jgi:tetratricopeptide (TPR) repeat protein
MVLDLLGTVSSLMGEYGDARDFYRDAVAKSPRHPPFLLNLANNLIYHGETDAAESIFRQIIEIQPNSPQAHWSLSGSRRASDHTHIEHMRVLASTENLHPRALAFYHYAIGKEYEDLQDWDAAFDAISAGAACRRQTVEFDETTEIEMFDFLQEKFTSDWLNRAGIGHGSTSPIFVLGQPRTGTTLIERIIGSHSSVHSAGELQQFGLAIRRLSDYRDPKRFSAPLFEAALSLAPGKIGSMYLDTTRRMQGDTPHFIDKLPQNYLFIPLILAALPNAKIVHLTRDPRDACFSGFKQLFADAYLHSYDQREMARHHARYWRLMNVWRERFTGRFLDISYEDVVRNLDSSVRRLIEYLGLPWEDACLNFHRQQSAVSTASAVQVREPAHTRSIGRWRRYEQNLVPMLEELRAQKVDLTD